MFPEPTKFQVKVFIALIVIGLCVEYTLIHFQITERFSVPQTTFHKVTPPAPIQPEKVVIGLVSCQAKFKSTPERLFYGMEINEESLVTIKSILISARLYGIPQVDFHIFVEKEDDPAWYHKHLARNNWVEDVGLEVNLYFHSAVDAVPDTYKKHMVYHIPYRCGFVRMFFSTTLPDVDSIIYFDTDMIVTGNIAKLWQRLGQMENEQVIGVARNNEPENDFVDILPGFGDLLPLHDKAPKGLNSGMLVMNLTKMREHRWQERFLRFFDDFSKIYDNFEDQQRLTFSRILTQLHLVPCQFDLIHTNCDYGWFCEPALEDPYGIQVVHGAGNQFAGSGRFKSIFRAYQDFTWRPEHAITGRNTSSSDYNVLQTFVEKVARPVRKSYELHNKVEKTGLLAKDSKCYGSLNKLLFKNFENVL